MLNRPPLIHGCCVYLLMLQRADVIRIKLGVSMDPIRRLRHLTAACSTQPNLLAIADLGTRQRARRAEKALHDRMARWKRGGGWFELPAADKPAFRAAWLAAFALFSRPSRPLRWIRISANALRTAVPSGDCDLSAASRFKRRGAAGSLAYRDFCAHRKLSTAAHRD